MRGRHPGRGGPAGRCPRAELRGDFQAIRNAGPSNAAKTRAVERMLCQASGFSPPAGKPVRCNDWNDTSAKPDHETSDE
jgi:hypothetical protein